MAYWFYKSTTQIHSLFNRLSFSQAFSDSVFFFYLSDWNINTGVFFCFHRVHDKFNWNSKPWLVELICGNILKQRTNDSLYYNASLSFDAHQNFNIWPNPIFGLNMNNSRNLYIHERDKKLCKSCLYLARCKILQVKFEL